MEIINCVESNPSERSINAEDQVRTLSQVGTGSYSYHIGICYVGTNARSSNMSNSQRIAYVVFTFVSINSSCSCIRVRIRHQRCDIYIDLHIMLRVAVLNRIHGRFHCF